MESSYGALEIQVNTKPIVGVGGGGSYLTWQLGALKAIKEAFADKEHIYAGSSAGAISSALTICNVDPLIAIHRTLKAYMEAGIPDRMLGLAFVWGKIIRKCLEDLLPEDAVNLCNGRLIVEVAEWRGIFEGFVMHRVQKFHTRQQLVDVIIASCHIPWFFDGKLSVQVSTVSKDGAESSYQGIDGSILQFLPILKCFGIQLDDDDYDEHDGIDADNLDYEVIYDQDPELQNEKFYTCVQYFDLEKSLYMFERGYTFTKQKISDEKYAKLFETATIEG